MSEREYNLPEVIMFLGNSEHKAAKEYCEMVERISLLESQRRTLQRCLETLLNGDFATDPEKDDMRRRLIISALSCLKESGQ